MAQGTVMNLYLGQSGGILGEAVEGQLLNAARLGLKFNQDASSAVILRLTENSNHSGAQVNNTVVNGTNIGSGQVLSYQNGAVVPVANQAFQYQITPSVWKQIRCPFRTTP